MRYHKGETRRRRGTVAKTLGVIAALTLGWTAVPAFAVDVDVVITVDNAYGFGFGDSTGMTTTSYYGGLRNTSAADITNGVPVLFNAGDSNAGNGYTNPGVGPELYDLNSLPASDYLYLVTWSDDFALQGAIGSFTVGTQTIGTVDGVGWEVYATGIDRDSNIVGDTLTNSAADITLINSQIALANSETGGAGTSIGWVDESGMMPSGNPGVGVLAFGDQNDGNPGGTHPFGVINGVPTASRWMWYNEDPATISNPFDAGPEGPDGHNEFLIFRIPVENVPEPGSAMLMLTAAFGILRRLR